MARATSIVLVALITFALVPPLPASASAAVEVCAECEPQRVVVTVTSPDGGILLARDGIVVAPGLSHFAVAAVGFNDPGSGGGIVAIDELGVVRRDGSAASFDFAEEPELARGAGTTDVLRWSEEFEALHAVANSGVSCATPYETLDLGGPVASVAFDIARVSPRTGDHSWWSLHVGLVGDPTAAVEETSCADAHPTGFVDGLAGIDLAGDGANFRREVLAIFDGSEIGARGVLAPFETFRVEIAVEPLARVTGGPDLVVGVLKTTPHWLDRSSGYDVYATLTAFVWNAGDAAASSSTADVLLGEALAASWDVPALAPGDVVVLRFVADDWSDPRWTNADRATVFADVDDEVVETGEVNVATTHFVTTQWGPQVLVGGIHESAPAFAGDTTTTYVALVNRGYDRAYDIDVTLERDGATVATWHVADIGGEGSQLLAVPLVATAGTHRYVARAVTHVEDRTLDDDVLEVVRYVPVAASMADLAVGVALVVTVPSPTGDAGAFRQTVVVMDVCNVGRGPAYASTLALDVESVTPAGPPAVTPVARFAHGVLVPGACVTRTVSHEPVLALGEYAYVARAALSEGEEDEFENNVDRAPAGQAGSGFGLVVG